MFYKLSPEILITKNILTKDTPKTPYYWVEVMKYRRETTDKAKQEAMHIKSQIHDILCDCLDILSDLTRLYIDEKIKLNEETFKSRWKQLLHGEF